ncbi:MAG TPA: DUF4124 domain-containing protein, partial [Arenicellales bacterium]|nr:DUF4124 domain-containing protein [Arenicellales bacterium]
MTGITDLLLKSSRLVALGAALTAGAVHAQSITKCQDAEGNWHYGDFAAEACARESTVTEMDERGLKMKESDAPPTPEELEAKRAAEEQEKLEAERRARQQAENQRLLRVYDSEEAVIRARDERVSAIEQELESHQLFRRDLVEERDRARSQGNEDRANELSAEIRQYDQAIQRLTEERGEVARKYNQDLEKYRELTGG